MERRKKLSYLWYFGLEGEQMERDVQIQVHTTCTTIVQEFKEAGGSTK